MAQDTLLGFPAHTLPYRRGEFTTLSTVSVHFCRLLKYRGYTHGWMRQSTEMTWLNVDKAQMTYHALSN